jgi:dTDP-4-amino-4,6-dideoxygalactose transaminase
LLDKLHKNGIGAEAYYTNPVHQMPYYRKNFGSRSLPQTEKAARQVFSLPIHPGVTQEQVKFIGKTVLQLL